MTDTESKWTMSRREMLGATAAALVLPLLSSRPLEALTRFNFAPRYFTPAEFASRVRSCEVRKTPEVVSSASDHFPLLVELADES